jgi:REP element-mobilizing transposase RayT
VIRNKTTLKILKRAIENARGYGLRILQFSMQKNHVHLIIEADNNEILTRGMRSLTITMAKGIDMGRIQVARYHLHVLRSRIETRNAVHYVLFNEQKHEKGTCSTVDEYGSLFSMSNVREMIRDFTKKNRKTIRLGSGERWLPDIPGSHLMRLVSS